MILIYIYIYSELLQTIQPHYAVTTNFMSVPATLILCFAFTTQLQLPYKRARKARTLYMFIHMCSQTFDLKIVSKTTVNFKMLAGTPLSSSHKTKYPR